MNGLRFETSSRTIHEYDLMQFVTLSGFTEPLFMDAHHAARFGYADRLVPGALVYSLAEGLLIQTGWINGTGIAFMQMELSIHLPTFVGDTVRVAVETVEARPTSNPGRGVVTSRMGVLNQRDEEVLHYTSVRLVSGEQPIPAPARHLL